MTLVKTECQNNMPWSKRPFTMAVLFEAGQKTTLIRKAMCDCSDVPSSLSLGAII